MLGREQKTSCWNFIVLGQIFSEYMRIGRSSSEHTRNCMSYFLEDTHLLQKLKKNSIEDSQSFSSAPVLFIFIIFMVFRLSSFEMSISMQLEI